MGGFFVGMAFTDWIRKFKMQQFSELLLVTGWTATTP